MEKQYFIVRGLDAPDSGEARSRLVDAHRAYIRKEGAVTMVHGGPLLGGEGDTIGTCLIVIADGKTDVEKWLSHCPFVAGGVFQSLTVERWGWTFGR